MFPKESDCIKEVKVMTIDLKRIKAERAAIRDSGIAPTFRAAPCVKRVKAERAAMSHE